jgi:hypothetical protein
MAHPWILRAASIARLLALLVVTVAAVGACGGAPGPGDAELGGGGDSVSDDDGGNGGIELASDRPSPPDPLEQIMRTFKCPQLVDVTREILEVRGDLSQLPDTPLRAQLLAEELAPQEAMAEAELFHGLGILCIGGSDALAADHFQRALELQTALSQESFVRLHDLDLSDLPDNESELSTVLDVEPLEGEIEETPEDDIETPDATEASP